MSHPGVRSLLLAAACGLLSLPGIAGGDPAGARAGPQDRQVTCGSNQNREEFCPAQIGGAARVVRELSSAPCIEGETWRWDSRGFHVRRGCRAQFAYRPSSGGGGGWDRPPTGGWNPVQPFELTCESLRHRWASCPANINGRVNLVRQISDAPCIRNRTWGQMGNQAIWVSDGCRARFQVSGSRSSQPMRTGEGLAPPGVQPR